MKKFISVVLAMAILSSVFFVIPSNAAYENTHVNTGNQTEDLIAVATTQIGYKEGNSSSQLTGTVAGSGNYTKYGAWYGINPGSWCAMFVSWCANQAGISTSIIPNHASCDIGMNYFKNQGTWGWGKYWANYNGYSVYTPVRGDIVYFGSGNLNDSTHVGIVYEVDSSYIYTIEGNTSNKCAYKQYAIDDDYIYGYGHPNYNGSGSGTSTPTGASSISLSGATYPTSLSVGSSFGLDGVISSKYKLTWVRVAVYNNSGSITIGSTKTPNSTTFNLDVVDAEIKFGTLSAGTYVYCIEAKDANGTYEMLLMQPFTVGTTSQTQTTFKYTVTTSGGTLNIRSGTGTSYSILGAVPNGTALAVQKISGNWAYITYNGISGWVSMDYLAIGYSPDNIGSVTTTSVPTATPTPTQTTTPEQNYSLELTDGNGTLSLSDSYLLGLSEKQTSENVISQFLRPETISISENENNLSDSDFVGTGCLIYTKKNSQVMDSATVIVLGDVNGDGKVTTNDYIKIKKHFSQESKLEGIYFRAADVDEDNRITTLDYIRVKKYFSRVYNLYG